MRVHTHKAITRLVCIYTPLVDSKWVIRSFDLDKVSNVLVSCVSSLVDGVHELEDVDRDRADSSRGTILFLISTRLYYQAKFDGSHSIELEVW